MQFSTIGALVGWAFQVESIGLVQTQKYREQQAPAFADLTPHDIKTQAAMVMAKVNRLPVEERAVLWALHVCRETEVVYLSAKTPCRYGMATEQDIIRKWATGDGPGCREVGARHRVSHMTASRYEREVVMMLEGWMHKAYATLEIQHRSLLDALIYVQRLTA